MKYLPLFHHFKAIYQFPKHIIFLVKILANASLSINKMLCGTSNVKFMIPALNRMIFYLTGSRDPNLLYHRLDLLPANNMCLHLKQLATEGKIF